MEQAGQSRAAAALPREMGNEGLPTLCLSQTKNGRFKPKKENTFVFTGHQDLGGATRCCPGLQKDILGQCFNEI